MDMKRLWRACLVLMAAVCIGLGGQGPAEAAPQVIEATGVYIMGDNDSPKIARDAARQEAMRAAVEKAGVYVESYSRTKNMQLTEDDVKMISGAVLKVIKEDSVPELSGTTMKIVLAGEGRAERVLADDGEDAAQFVGDHCATVADAVDEDAAVAFALGDGEGSRVDEVREVA